MTITRETVSKGMKVSEAAQTLGVSRQMVHKYIQSGKIRVVAREETSGRGVLWVNRNDVAKIAGGQGE